MTPESVKSRRLVGLFLFGWVLFNYPILSLVNVDGFWFGIPLLYLYMFAVWLIFIASIGIITKFDKPPHPPPEGYLGK